MRTIFLFIAFYCLVFDVYSQNRNNVWCFGDSAGINFQNSGLPVPITSEVYNKGSCVSISDSLGQLLFYAATQGPYVAQTYGWDTKVWDGFNNLMQNGDSIIGEGWYHELIIIPKPNSTLYYLFTNSITFNLGTKYSVIDMSQNGGLGVVVQKNVPLSNNDVEDDLAATKHGNGRDWWVLTHRDSVNSRTFYKFLVTPTGIAGPFLQLAGSQHGGYCPLVFSPNGNKLLQVNQGGLVEVMDFNRCTGMLSNPILIAPQISFWPSNAYFGASFSPNGNLIYVSNVDNIFGDSLRLYQYDLTAANIPASRVTLFSQPVPASGGLHALGPDGKIYISCLHSSGFPYSSNTYNIYNQNLSVINNPDVPGLGCNFSPFSFYLGGKRTYWGLPNNPNYDLGAWTGSPCDTLTSVEDMPIITNQQELKIFYHPYWQKAFINAAGLKGKKYLFTVVDAIGRLVFKTEGNLTSEYFTKDLDCSDFSNGLYLVNLITDKEKLSGKFVKH